MLERKGVKQIMKATAKKKTQPSSRHGIKQSLKVGAKSPHSEGFRVKKQVKTKMTNARPVTIEQEYVRLFTVPQTPHQCFYSDDYNLEQPSALKYVPSTTAPNTEV
jgi:hypothetical protein